MINGFPFVFPHAPRGFWREHRFFMGNRHDKRFALRISPRWSPFLARARPEKNVIAIGCGWPPQQDLREQGDRGYREGDHQAMTPYSSMRRDRARRFLYIDYMKTIPSRFIPFHGFTSGRPRAARGTRIGHVRGVCRLEIVGVSTSWIGETTASAKVEKRIRRLARRNAPRRFTPWRLRDLRIKPLFVSRALHDP